MKSILVGMLLVAIGVGCKKTEDDISGTAEMSGKVLIENIYDSLPAKLLPSQQILFFNDTTSAATSFMFSKDSDKDGFFSFPYIYPDKFYRLRSEIRLNTTNDNGVLFSADSVLKPSSRIDLVLRPNMVKQNALLINCFDTLLVSGRLPYVSIYIYTSRVLATLDSGAISGAGASYRFNSRTNGTAFKVNLPTDSLFANAILRVGTSEIKCKVQGLNSISAIGLTRDTIYLR